MKVQAAKVANSPKEGADLTSVQESKSGMNSPTGNPRSLSLSAESKSTARHTIRDTKPVSKLLSSRDIVAENLSPEGLRDTSAELNIKIKKIKQHVLKMRLKAELPAKLHQAQANMIKARDALLATSEAAPLKARQANVDNFTKANFEYIKAFSSEINLAKQGDGKPVNPSFLNSMGNIAIGMANNFSFTVPAVAGNLVGGLPGVAITATGTAAGVELSERLSRTAKGKLGMANPQLRLSTNSHGINGPYKSIQSKAVDQAVGTLVYAVTRALLLQIDKSEGEFGPGKIILAGLLSAFVMNTVKEGIYNLLAETDVTKLPIMDGSRAKNLAVVYHQQPDNLDVKWNQLDTTKAKASAAMAGAGALGLGATNLLTAGFGTGVGGEALKIGLAFSAFFGMKDIVEGAALKDSLDPRANPKVAISDLQNLQGFLKESSMESIVSGLNHMVAYLNSGDESNVVEQTSRQQFADIRNALSLTPTLNNTAAEGYGKAAKALESSVESLDNIAKENPIIEKARSSLKNAQIYLQDMSAVSSRGNATGTVANDNLAFLEAKDTMQNVTAHLRMAQAQLVHSNLAHGSNEAIEQIANDVLPVLAALRDADMAVTAQKFVMSLGEYNAKSDGSRDKTAESLSARLSAQGTNEISPHVLAKLVNSNQNTKDHALEQLMLVGELGGDNVGQAKAAIVKNIVDRMPLQPSELPVQFSVSESKIDSLANDNSGSLNEFGTELLGALTSNEVGAESLAEQLESVMDDQRTLNEIEAKSPRLSALIGELGKTFPGSPTRQLVVAANESVRQFSMGAVDIHRKHDGLLKAATSFEPVFGNKLYGNSPDSVNQNIKQKDVHFHPTDYDSRRNSDLVLSYLMGENGIEKSIYEGIPHTMKSKTYYDKLVPQTLSEQIVSFVTGDNSGANIVRYDASADFKLGHSLKKTEEQVPDISTKIILSITGFDVNDGKHMGDHMDEVMRQYPDLVKSVGEVTLYKEVISKASAQIPVIDSDATRTLFDASAERGLPIVLHCDVSIPGNKGKFRNDLIKVIKESASKINTPIGKIAPTDKLAASVSSGNNDVPAKKLSVIWAHGAGISRYTRASNDHTVHLNNLFNDPVLDKDTFNIDLSWDYVAKNMLLNVSDLLTKEGFPQNIVDGIQAIMQSYDSFIAQGGRADEANDGINQNLAALHKVGADNLAQLHLETLSSFKPTLELELRNDPTLLKKFVDMMHTHGDNGNNWLNVMSSNSDRMMFGSDSLSPGAKYHGEMAYNLNVKMLYPLYDIFQAVGDKLEEVEASGVGTDQYPISSDTAYTVVSNIAQGTFNRVIESPALQERRGAYLTMLSNTANKPTANVAPISRYEGSNV